MDFLMQKLYTVRQKLVDKGWYDSRFLILFGIAAVSVSVFWSGAKIIQQNYELDQKVAEIQKENEILELENRNKELQNEFLKTDEFAEITARRVFGKAAKGETVYIVPKDVALGALTETEAEETELKPVEKPQYQKNVEAWLDIYFNN